MALPQPIPYDAESKLKEWESVPLFMKDLPKEGESDQALDAIQALVYDGTPDGKKTLNDQTFTLTLTQRKKSPLISKSKGMITSRESDIEML